MRIRPFRLGALLCILLFSSIALTYSRMSVIPRLMSDADGGIGVKSQDTRSKRHTPTNLVLAQSDSPTLPRWMPSSGGGVITESPATGGELRASVTFGHSFTGVARSDDYTLTTGFWRAPKVNRVLAIYALALDNNPISTNNLTAYHRAAIDKIIKATENDPAKIAIVLVDLTGSGNTRLLRIENGTPWPITTLPALGGEPARTIGEFDMTNGRLIGRVIKWAMDNYPANNSYFAYVGHGVPLAPKTDVLKIFPNYVSPSGLVTAAEILPPLPPSRKWSHPDITDFNDRGLISPYELRQALAIGTDNGQNPLTVVDLTHCFAASLEEFYELSNPGEVQFAKVMIGSPNYTYFGTDLLQRTLSNLTPAQTPTEMANSIVRDYHNILLEADAKITDTTTFGEHPHIVVAVDSTKLQPLKATIDTMSTALLEPANFDEAKITRVHQNSPNKYDTTYCAPQDWELTSMDGLTDLADFSAKLANEYSSIPSVRDPALAIASQIATAIITSTRKSGLPWFAEKAPKPSWNFGGSGLALYTDFQGIRDTQGITNFVSWHAYWYTDTVRPATDAYPNEYPYTFVQSANSATWADVFHRFWLDKTVRGDFCLPEFPPIVTNGELSFDRVIFPLDLPGMLSVNSPARIAVAVRTAKEAQNALVKFTIADASGVITTNIVSAGDMITGVHMVEATALFTPSRVGTIVITATVDPDNRFIEPDEAHNTITKTYSVDAGNFARPTIGATIPSQWVTGNQIAVTVTQNIGDEIEDLRVFAYQYKPAEGAPNTQVASKVYATNPNLPDGSKIPIFPDGSILLEDVNIRQPILIPFSPWQLAPGPVEVHLWGYRGLNPSKFPAIIKFNYTPAGVPIAVGETQYFLFEADIGDEVELDLNVLDDINTDANLFIWHTDNYWSIDGGGINAGDDKVKFRTPFTGKYIVSVYGETAAQYDVIASQTHNQTPDIASAQSLTVDENLAKTVFIPTARPIFLPPIPELPWGSVYLPTIMLNYVPPSPDLTITNLRAITNNIQVTIRNAGVMTVTDDFWVDVYIDPSPIPTGPNQIWPGLSFQGMVWAVTAPAVPLAPGGEITLTLGGAYYTPTLSLFTAPLLSGTPVYVQVDSANEGVDYGAVREANEQNNIVSTTVTTDSSLPAPTWSDVTEASASTHQSHLPPRPSVPLPSSDSLPPSMEEGLPPASENPAVITTTIGLTVGQE